LSDEITVLSCGARCALSSQLEESNLTCFVVSEQPVVRVSAIIILKHNPDIVINRVAVLQRFPRAKELGEPAGSNEVKPVIVVSVIIMPASLIPKSSSLTITPGRPSIKMRWPLIGLMSKMMFQRSPTM